MKVRSTAWRAAGAAVLCLCSALAAGCGEPSSAAHDPCMPNPCKQAGMTTCTSVEGEAMCSCEGDLVPDGRGGCTDTAHWNDGVAGSAVSAKDPTTFTAHVRVLDQVGQPIEGATLTSGDHFVKTDGEGVATFAGLASTEPVNVRLSADGHIPATRLVSVTNAGMNELVVELLPLGKARTFTVDHSAHLQAGPADISLPEHAFVDDQGVRAQGQITAHVVGFAASAQDERSWPGDRKARNARGEPTLVERWLGGVHAQFEDGQGKSLQLGPGSTATLRIALAENAGVAEGDQVGLWSLDEATGNWLLESHCTVVGAKSGATSVQTCEGEVPHFSTWAAGVEWDIYAPGTLGCVNLALDVKLPDGYVGNTRLISAMQCDGDTCGPSVPWYQGQSIFLPADDSHDPSFCSIADARKNLRVTVALDVKNTQPLVPGTKPSLADGTYVHVTDAYDFKSFDDVLGSQVMLNQTLEPESDCRLLCRQVTITLDEKSLQSDNIYSDEDGDGFFTRDGAGSGELFGQIDCDDDNRLVYPGAYELPCGGVDYDCDGQAPQATKLTWHDVSDPNVWNARCGLACAEPDSKETAGNLYDEDCDGKVQDADQDGYTTYDDPPDCDDTNPGAHPGGKEVAGNRADEDCDGVALDADGDGYFGWGQEFTAFEQLGVDPDAEPERFGDCDDHNPNVHPGVPVEDEVGQIAFLYHEQPDGTLARSAQFCDYFDESGRPNGRLEYLLVDYNCDGYVTDIDGDGWSAPSDPSLGADRAFDCNDLEPRMHPTEMPTMDTDGGLIAPECKAPPASELANDSVCLPDVPSDGCSPLLLEGKSVPTSCWAVPNDQMLDLSFCIYGGWDSGNPLKWSPGQPWGPCDGDVLLAPCPEGYSCGGVQPYTDALEGYLEQKYTGGKPIDYKGMCFKTCTGGMATK